ncbi:MAG: GAF domain-containing protein [Proteobacteria bacterium]|nr:GAF domain-containing protein [Pseudomonadota bacterium]
MPPEPVVEPSPDERKTEVTPRSLEERIRQQEILAELGVFALQGASFEELLTETSRLTASALRAEFCKVLEYIPAEHRLLVRAGVGWAPGIVGVASIGADLGSPAGFALRTGKPVISNHLKTEDRFRTPEILAVHGIKRAMNVILQGDGKPFGVLEVDSRSEEQFVENDLAFLQGAANILGMAIERERYESHLKAALERHQTLLKEMNHRIKNSLTIVATMLRLQAAEHDDKQLVDQLGEASQRVHAVARAHERLYQSDNVEMLDLGNYIELVSQDLMATLTDCDIRIDVEKEIIVPTDRAISLALVETELVTNAAKYARAGAKGATIWVTLVRVDEKTAKLSVRDEGVGFPLDFTPEKSKSLGMRIIASFAQQLDARVEIQRHSPGTEFIVTVPLIPATN